VLRPADHKRRPGSIMTARLRRSHQPPSPPARPPPRPHTLPLARRPNDGFLAISLPQVPHGEGAGLQKDVTKLLLLTVRLRLPARVRVSAIGRDTKAAHRAGAPEGGLPGPGTRRAHESNEERQLNPSTDVAFRYVK